MDLSDPANDLLNHGWLFETITEEDLGEGLRIVSLGADGILDSALATPGDAYAQDLAVNVGPQDWQIDLGALQVSVTNETEEEFPDAGDNLRLVVLVYEHAAFDSDNPVRWRRINGNLFSDRIAGGSDALLTFPANSSVPIGRHLLLLVTDPDSEANSGDEQPVKGPLTDKRVRSQISLFVRTHPQQLRLNIR